MFLLGGPHSGEAPIVLRICSLRVATSSGPNGIMPARLRHIVTNACCQVGRSPIWATTISLAGRGASRRLLPDGVCRPAGARERGGESGGLQGSAVSGSVALRSGRSVRRSRASYSFLAHPAQFDTAPKGVGKRPEL